MSLLIQNIIVALVVLGAALFVVRRIVQALRMPKSEAGCDGCALRIDAPPPAGRKPTRLTEPRPAAPPSSSRP